MLARMVWGTLFREELSKFKWAYPWFGGSKRLPGWFGALARLSAGGGQILFGQCPNAERVNPKGSSLTPKAWIINCFGFVGQASINWVIGYTGDQVIRYNRAAAVILKKKTK